MWPYAGNYWDIYIHSDVYTKIKNLGYLLPQFVHRVRFGGSSMKTTKKKKKNINSPHVIKITEDEGLVLIKATGDDVLSILIG